MRRTEHLSGLFLDVHKDPLSLPVAHKALVSTKQIGRVYLTSIKILPRRMIGKSLLNYLSRVLSALP